MKTLRDKALSEIERSGDAAARRSFLYWTWEFDAFVEYADMVDAVMAQAAEPTPTSGNPVVPSDDDAAARFQGGTAEVNHVRIANVRRHDGPVKGCDSDVRHARRGSPDPDEKADRRSPGISRTGRPSVTGGAGSGDPRTAESEIRFDLSWGHTWRARWTEPAANNVTGEDLPAESWSAAWVFAKFLTPQDQENNDWRHATLSADAADHVVPGTATLDVGLTDGKGMGVFVYRAAPGQGPLELKNVKLRWLHGADGVEDAATADLKLFAIEMVYVPRGTFAVGSGGTEAGSFTDGCWKHGPAIPLLVDAKWSGPVAEGNSARHIGKAPGRLWGTSEEGKAAIGPDGAVSDAFPTGYEAFYCMRYEVTRRQFADFLNTITKDVFHSTSAGDDQHAGAHFTAAGRYSLSGAWPNFEPARPHQACNLLSWWDGAKFAAWAGLRPMTELEYEKACRGPLRPVPNECAWGTAAIASAPYAVTGEGTADERITENYRTTAGNANYDFTMPDFYGGAARGGVSAVPGSPMRAGIFTTPDSGRIAAGASYWGIMELSGNVREQVVSVSDVKGRAFQGTHGPGTPDVPADWPEANYCRGTSSGENDGIGSGLRGGFFGDTPFSLRVSDRSRAAYRPRAGSFSVRSRQDQNGFRAVRTAHH
jgi:formylglycine-generating enzyme required for sulfatase activity